MRVIIPDTITHIEDDSFADCHSLKSIRLPRNLVSIRGGAFYECRSLQAVFLPPTVRHIGNQAFGYCKSLRFCNLPETIEREHVDNEVFEGCHRLCTRVRINRRSRTVRNNLTKVCYSTSVTSQMINECIHTHGIRRTMEIDYEQMTALHILCANPHVTGDCIHTYLQLAPEAANQQDSKGMTPFQYLCRNDITVFEDRSFSSLMIWWYHCMPPQTQVITAINLRRGQRGS